MNERSKNIRALIQLFADLDMVALQKGDILGDAYEYLIGQFAMESGKKAGEFYTPRQVSEVMAQIVTKSAEIKSIYDPTVGSGSLLLTVARHLSKTGQKNLNYYGQEKNTATYNLTRMNLLLHGVMPGKMTIKNGDTLAQDWPEDPERPNEGVLFDAVVMNPPYSAKNWNRAGLKVSDPRFEIAGVLPPESKGDFAFLLHGLFHLGTQGTMAIVLPHGVLFRGATEGEIRKRLLEKNYIDTIIGMPAGMFTNTGIPVVILILKKNRALNEPVLIIDASNGFVKAGKQNVLREKDIAKIVDTYVDRSVSSGYSHLASREEIIENEYNLNIPRYVGALDQEIPHDVDAHMLGGIPMKNIESLSLLQTVVPDIMKKYLAPLREGYVELTGTIDELTDEVLAHSSVIGKAEEIAQATSVYIEKYWVKLREVDSSTDLKDVMEKMLFEMKEMLRDYRFLDTYDGYQIIAELWNDSLTHDTELIAASDFYSVGRSRERNMVTKGSGNTRRQEQDGWKGTIIPNELLMRQLYQVEQEKIEKVRTQLVESETELSELVEAAKEEDSEENAALYECLKMNANDEPGDAFESKKIKAEMKLQAKASEAHNLLSKVDGLMTEISRFNSQIKTMEKALSDAVQERILNLTNEEIDTLMFEKWFGKTESAMESLVKNPLLAEIDTLKLLHNRYADTLADIEEESKALEEELEALLSQLVVTE